jgi:two-component system chemotaxis sensor kinase CheA
MASDPYKYFRLEARELLDQCGQCVLDLERGGAATQPIQRLLRLAHTLKGAARVVRQGEIADHAHALEDVLAPLRGGTGSVGRAGIDALLSHLDEIGRLLPALAPPGTDNVPAPARPAAEEAARSVRADLAELDGVLDGVAETHALLSSLRSTARRLEQARHLVDLLSAPLAPRGHKGGTPDRPFAVAEELRRTFDGIGSGLDASIDQMDRELHQLRATAERLRLVSVDSLFATLERTARDTAHSVSKQIVFRGSGDEIRLDSHVLGTIRPALIQIIRNAVAHGVELPEKRLLAGKPAAGQISVAVSRRGQRILFECRDDGGGVDFAAIRRVARQRGLLGADGSERSAEELVRLLLGGGISTSGAVTDVSGRGIGLDIVREAIERLGGEIAIHTEAGLGTAIELIVPPSLTALEALLAICDEQRIAIPLDAVRRTLRIGRGELARQGSGVSVAYGNEAVAFMPLTALLGQSGRQPDRHWTVIIIGGANGLAAIGVDRLLGTGQIVIRPLPDYLPVNPIIAGAMLDAEGNPQLVLDPDGLGAAVQGGNAGEPGPAPERHPVLVIDDSLTTRMLEQSILESAGFEVDLAVSAENGLEAARRKRYALFLVDVEMPGMDGFAFVERIRADPGLHDIPAILVTSRAAVEDLQRGRAAGAQGYVVKSEFDQAKLLALIRTLVE